MPFSDGLLVLWTLENVENEFIRGKHTCQSVVGDFMQIWLREHELHQFVIERQKFENYSM